MIRTLVVDDDAVEEGEAQTRYYLERAGEVVARRFADEIEAIYRGLAEARFVGVNHPRVTFRVPLKRVFLDRFPFPSCSMSKATQSASSRWRRSASVLGMAFATAPPLISSRW